MVDFVKLLEKSRKERQAKKDVANKDVYVSGKEVFDHYASRIEFLNSKDSEVQHDLQQ